MSSSVSEQTPPPASAPVTLPRPPTPASPSASASNPSQVGNAPESESSTTETVSTDNGALAANSPALAESSSASSISHPSRFCSGACVPPAVRPPGAPFPLAVARHGPFANASPSSALGAVGTTPAAGSYRGPHLQHTLPSASAERHIAEARRTVDATIRNLLDSQLQDRAKLMHDNMRAISSQQRNLGHAIDGLRVVNDAMDDLVAETTNSLKKIGDVQNWAEIQFQGLTSIEETLRLVRLRDARRSERRAKRVQEREQRQQDHQDQQGSGSAADVEGRDEEGERRGSSDGDWSDSESYSGSPSGSYTGSSRSQSRSRSRGPRRSAGADARNGPLADAASKKDVMSKSSLENPPSDSQIAAALFDGASSKGKAVERGFAVSDPFEEGSKDICSQLDVEVAVEPAKPAEVRQTSDESGKQEKEETFAENQPDTDISFSVTKHDNAKQAAEAEEETMYQSTFGTNGIHPNLDQEVTLGMVLDIVHDTNTTREGKGKAEYDNGGQAGNGDTVNATGAFCEDGQKEATKTTAKPAEYPRAGNVLESNVAPQGAGTKSEGALQMGENEKNKGSVKIDEHGKLAELLSKPQAMCADNKTDGLRSNHDT